MIRVYRNHLGGDVILTVGDGFDLASVHLDDDDLAGLFDAINKSRATTKEVIFDLETHGSVPLEQGPKQERETP